MGIRQYYRPPLPSTKLSTLPRGQNDLFPTSIQKKTPMELQMASYIEVARAYYSPWNKIWDTFY